MYPYVHCTSINLQLEGLHQQYGGAQAHLQHGRAQNYDNQTPQK